MVSNLPTAADRPRFVAYYRVSTAGQGRSGLGLEAQRDAVRAFTSSRGGFPPLAEFTEVESGKVNARPQLEEAMRLCRAYRATLVIAKLDRLSRNASFLLALRDAGVQFVAVDMPDANNLTVGIMALVAQQEREAISARTKAALAVAKARGKRVGGGPGPDAEAAARGRDAAREARKGGAVRRAEDLAPVIERLQAEEPGASLRRLADRLNAEGVPTPSGRGLWQAVTLQRVLSKLAPPPAA